MKFSVELTVDLWTYMKPYDSIPTLAMMRNGGLTTGPMWLAMALSSD